MRMSQLLGRRWRDRGQATGAASNELLLRAGYVRHHATGIYSYLNLGLRCLRRIEAVVREEMARTGAQEILMPVVHSADVWKRTGRYDEVDETLVRFEDRRGRAMVLAMTHEEIVAELAASDVRSYRDTGVVVYQIQTKFRDELRPRGGLLRTREFIMKDAYSLHLDAAGMEEAYAVQADAYHRVYRRVGLRGVHQVRSRTGVMGGSVAHEFMCPLDVGEDTVSLCEQCGAAWNAELSSSERCEACDGAVRHARGVTLPPATAPFDAHLVTLGEAAAGSSHLAADVYSRCTAAGLDILWDDRGVGAGEQLADADLIGAPIRVTVGRGTMEVGTVELRERRTGRVTSVGAVDVAGAVTALSRDLDRAAG